MSNRTRLTLLVIIMIALSLSCISSSPSPSPSESWPTRIIKVESTFVTPTPFDVTTDIPTIILTPTPETEAPPFTEIQNYIETETEARWKAYLPTLKGMKVTNWTGWVEEVNVPAGGFEAIINMRRPNCCSDVRFAIPEVMAMKLDFGQQLTFSGNIGYVSEFFGGCTVWLEDAVVEGY